MNFLMKALSAISAAGASPYALVAFSITVVAYVAVAWRVTRNKQLLSNLEKLPAKDRGPVLESEMRGYRLASGITPEQFLRAQTHRYLLVAFLVTIVLAASIVMLMMWSRAGALRAVQAPSSSRTTPEITLRSVEPVESEFDPMRGPTYEAHIKESAEFADSQFNTRAYLTALTNLGIMDTPVGASSVHNEDASLSEEGRVNSESIIYLYLPHSADALERAKIEFLVGPFQVSKTVGKVMWRKIGEPGENFRNIATLQARFVIPKPNWAFIRSARILPTDTKRKSILEVLVENMSDRDVAVTELNLSARQLAPRVACAIAGPPPPIVHLDWTRIVSVGVNARSAPIGWTKINESRVPITGSFSEYGDCSGPPRFETLVPMDYVIPASKVLSVAFEIHESGKTYEAGEARGSSSLRAPGLLDVQAPQPSDLKSWDHVFVGFGQHDEVYPRQVEVDLPSNVRVPK
jgi:hypothetical protein